MPNALYLASSRRCTYDEKALGTIVIKAMHNLTSNKILLISFNILFSGIEWKRGNSGLILKFQHLFFQVSSGKGTTLDFCRRFAEREKTNFISMSKLGKKTGIKDVNINNHKFQGVQCSSTTKCTVCGRLLWGIGIQGYQCQCEYF